MKVLLEHCKGCNDDFYNDHNPYGIKECWMRAKATLEPRLLIHVDQAPPYRQKAALRPTCYRAQRHITVKPDALNRDGYWKS